MSSDIDRFYLIVRDRWAGRTEVTEFADGAAAYEAYVLAEAQYRKATRGRDPEFEVLLVGGESEASVREMYHRYFTEGTRAERKRQLMRSLEHA